MAQAAPSQTTLVRRARRINRELARLYPDARLELDFTSPLELLVAAILAAQSTDRSTNEVTRVLFARYRTAADYAAADRAELEAVIHPTGYFRAKANTLISLGQALCDRFDEVWAVDQEADAIQFAARKAGERGVRNVRWIAGRAEDVDPANGVALHSSARRPPSRSQCAASCATCGRSRR